MTASVVVAPPRIVASAASATAAVRLGFGVALALGVLVRVLPVLGSEMPLGDGGLILAFVDDIRRAALALPATATYNDLAIPFVYPPLALYVGAVTGEVLGVDSLAVLRWLPLVIGLATLVAFALLARRILPPVAALGATLVFALMPHAYDGVIAGGGLTRGLGLLLAVAALLVACRPVPSRSAALLAGALLGLALLAHPQAGIFGVLAAVILTVGTAGWVRSTALAAAAGAVVVLPWLVLVTVRHGFGAMAGGGHRWEPVIGLIRMLNLDFSGAIFMDVFAAVGLLGMVAAVVLRSWRLPLLLLATYLAGTGAAEFLGAMPWALLGGFGIGFLVDAFLAVRRPTAGHAWVRGPAALAGAALLFAALVASVGSIAGTSSKLHAVTPDQRSAMHWVTANTPVEARFVVATSVVWGDDELSEWFPALAERRSVATVQGSEWLGTSGYQRHLTRHFAVLACRGETADCLLDLAGTIEADEAYIVVPRGRLDGAFSPVDCCPALRTTLFTSDRAEVVYDGPGATIARLRDP